MLNGVNFSIGLLSYLFEWRFRHEGEMLEKVLEEVEEYFEELIAKSFVVWCHG